MKHFKKRLLAFLLVLTMGIGLVPFAALSAGAETAIVTDITVGTDGVIEDLDWEIGYIASPYQNGDEAWQVVKQWNGAYRLSEIITVPKAYTTLVWTECVEAGALTDAYFFLTSWKQVGENRWEIDPAGTNLIADGKNDNANQIYTEVYDEESDTTKGYVTYTYTTTAENETVRLACFGGNENGEISSSPEECPTVYAYNASFAEGAVDGIAWFGGYMDADKGFVVDGDFVTSMPISVPNAGTTVSFSGECDEDCYVISAWRAADDGRLEMIYGCAGSEQSNAWTTVTEVEEETVKTYSYTTTYDNEIIRISVVGEAPAVTYVENNAANCAPILAAAGYDPTIAGEIFLSNWTNGLISENSNKIVLGSSAYKFSDVLSVYGVGTKITVVDVMNDTEAGEDNFAGDGAYVIAKFDGTSYDDTVADGITGEEDRSAAVKDGKRVYTYTTTEAMEYIRVSLATTGNTVNGGFVAPIIYISAPNNTYYNILEGLKIISIGENDHFGSPFVGDTWTSLFAARYGMTYVDMTAVENEENDELSTANIILFFVPSEYSDQIDAESVDELLTYYPNALCVFFTENTDLVADVEEMHNDRACVIAYSQLPALSGAPYTDVNGMNALAHRLLLPWLETSIGTSYQNFGGVSIDDAVGVKFLNDEDTVAMIGTSANDRTISVPRVPGAISSDNVFGWYGTVTNGTATETMLIRVGEKVTFAKGDVGEFEPLTFDMVQVEDPTLRMGGSVATSGLRFLSGVSESDYLNILAMIDAGQLQNASISMGTLIIPYDYMDALNGQLTHDALTQASLENLDVACQIALDADGNLVWYEYDDETGIGYIAGSISNILAQNNTRQFTARGYAKLTVDGEAYYIYAENGGKVGAAVYELAEQALNDCTTEQDADHMIEYKAGLYSPYTLDQRAILKSYVQNVVSLVTVDADGYTTAELTQAEYYDVNAGWEVYTLSGGGSDSLNDIFYPGAPDPETNMLYVDILTWSGLAAVLGDNNIDTVCMILPSEGVTTVGGVLLDGVTYDATAFELDDGTVVYLIGFSEYSEEFY